MASEQCFSMCRICTAVFGILCSAAGLYMYINWVDIFTQLRAKEMTLNPNSHAYSNWKSPPVPLNFDIYLFNWTNPKDFFEGSKKKPFFQQLGPYRFREVPDKVDLVWHHHNFSISYKKKSVFYFDVEGSTGSLEDKITTVNTVAHSAALRVKDENILVKNILQNTLKIYQEDITVTKTVDEILFQGYSDPLVTMGKFASFFSKDIEVPYDRVGWMYGRNGTTTSDGHFNVFTGVDNIYKTGQVYKWNYKNHNAAFQGDCGEVKGSEGAFYPPNLSTIDSIWIYLPNLCRAVPLDYTETIKVHGVTAYKFSAGHRAVDNGTRYPETKCFCVNNKCELAGAINIAPCKYNSSIYMTYPHFYKADPSYLEAVEGLSPKKSKHEMYMALEPNSGMVMEAGGGFQANYLIEPIKDLKPYHNVPRIFIPIMWCEERMTVPAEIAERIAIIPLIVLLGQILTGVLLASGLILICWYPTKVITQLCHNPKKKETMLIRLPTKNRLSLLTLKQSRQIKSYEENLPGSMSINPKYQTSIVTESLLRNNTQSEKDFTTSS